MSVQINKKEIGEIFSQNKFSDKSPNSPSDRLLRALEAVRAGRMVIMVDDEDRENEGDLVMAAEFITPPSVNFMITHARGLVCLPLTAERVDQLGLEMMVQQKQNTARYGTAFTVSIEAREGVSTGISAADRARTILVATAENAQPHDIATPGHIFPLRAAPGGVLERLGHTEGSIDLLRLAGLKPAAVICEILNEDGTMARRPALEIFAQKHNIPIISIAELVTWIRAHGLKPISYEAERCLQRVELPDLAQAALPSVYGGENLRVHAFRDRHGFEHVALVKGSIEKGAVPLVRVHSECVTGDVFGSLRCDCGGQLQSALRIIGRAECGVLVYVRGHEGHGQKPVAKFLVKAGQVIQGGVRRQFRVTAHIDPKIHFQSVTDTGFGNELPHAGSLGAAIRLHVETGFHQRQINKVAGHAPLGKLRINKGIVGGLARKRPRDEPTGLRRHVVDFLHDTVVKSNRQRKTPGIDRIQKVLDNADGCAVRHVFFKIIDAFDGNAVGRRRVAPFPGQVRIDIFQRLHNAERHLHLVNGILGTGKSAL